MALYNGSPVNLSHAIIVSLWFVIPMALMSDGSTPNFLRFSTVLSTQDSVELSKICKKAMRI